MVKLIGNYAKRLGLPGYSSHQFSVSVESELTDLGQVQAEATRLYSLLQDAVDREIEHVGFVPPDGYGLEGGNSNGHDRLPSNGNGGDHDHDHWACSEKQRELMLKLVDENHLDKDGVEQTAQDRFGTGVKLLNKLQMSGLISEILELCGKGEGGGDGNGSRKRQPAINGRRSR